MKTFTKSENATRVLYEVSILKQLDHPNIVKVLDTYPKLASDDDSSDSTDEGSYCSSSSIVSDESSDEQFRYGRERYVLVEPKYTTLDRVSFKDPERRHKLFVDILKALAYLDTKNIVHSDVKPDNIVYDKDTDKFMLIDFDLSIRSGRLNPKYTFITCPPEIAIHMAYDKEIIMRSQHRNFLRKQQKLPLCFDSRMDIFGLAVTLLKLDPNNYGTFIHDDDACNIIELYKISMNDDWDGFLPRDQPDMFIDLLANCLKLNPEDRPTAQDVLSLLGVENTYPSVEIVESIQPKLSDTYIAIMDKLTSDINYSPSRHVAENMEGILARCPTTMDHELATLASFYLSRCVIHFINTTDKLMQTTSMYLFGKKYQQREITNTIDMIVKHLNGHLYYL